MTRTFRGSIMYGRAIFGHRRCWREWCVRQPALAPGREAPRRRRRGVRRGRLRDPRVDVWRLSTALSWWRLLALVSASLAVTIVAVIVAARVVGARARSARPSPGAALQRHDGTHRHNRDRVALRSALRSSRPRRRTRDHRAGARGRARRRHIGARLRHARLVRGFLCHSRRRPRNRARVGHSRPGGRLRGNRAYPKTGRPKNTSVHPRSPARDERSSARRGIEGLKSLPSPQPRALPPPAIRSDAVRARAALSCAEDVFGPKEGHIDDSQIHRTIGMARGAPVLGAAEQRVLGCRPAHGRRELPAVAMSVVRSPSPS